MLFYYILILTLPLTQHWLLGGDGGVTVVKYIGLACFPFAAVRLLTRHRPSGIKFSGVGAAFSCYFVIAVVSYFSHGGQLTLEPTPLLNVSSMLLFFLITIGLVDTVERLHRVILVCIGSVGLASIYVIRDWLGNRQYAGYRPGGISGDANYFSLCASAALLLGLNLLFGKRSRREKLIILASLSVTSVALILAASRGGFVALGVGLIFLVVRLSRGLRPIALLLLLFVPLLFAVPNTTIQRIIHPSQGEDQAVQSRETTWRAGLRMFAAHPFTGIGLGHFMGQVVSYESPNEEPVESLAHNTYIEVAAEMGILGLLAWIAMFGLAFIAVNRFTKKEAVGAVAFLREASIGLQAALVTTAVGIFFLSASWFRFLWLLMFLPSCFGMIAAREQQTHSRESLEPILQPAEMYD